MNFISQGGGGAGGFFKGENFFSNLLRATMGGGFFFFFPREPGHNFYYKVFDGQDIFFKNLPPPPNQLYVP